MNFAYWNCLTADEKRGDVLRAFGQMLGLELEHRHIELNPTWSSHIEAYWTGEIIDIPWSKLKQYLFNPLASKNVIATNSYDPASIMIWPFVGRGLVTYPVVMKCQKVLTLNLLQLILSLLVSFTPSNKMNELLQ